VLLCLGIAQNALAQGSLPEGISLPTSLRTQASGWWPTKGEAGRDEYVGSAACARCHAEKAAAFQTTAMAHASSSAAASEMLHQYNPLDLRLGPYHYQIETAEKSVLRISDDKSSLSEDLLWAFGFGHMGQTYLYQQNGSFYEGHVSLYRLPQALDITPGQSRGTPQSFEGAAGRRLSPDETHLCFGCHTTASTTRNQFDPGNLVPGVTCEGCHGPGASHVALAHSGSDEPGLILNPARLDRVASVDFCGACHRTWEDVVVGGLTRVGVFNVRFAPYRLENSKCWKKGDQRITCVACHDPHQPLVRGAASYDSRCLACHTATRDKGSSAGKTTAAHPKGVCPVDTSNCVTCHMPVVEPPNLHSAFTDHWIRIVRKGATYPD
jgi:Cytochrome c554 and c-prime